MGMNDGDVTHPFGSPNSGWLPELSSPSLSMGLNCIDN